jgi:hypothetical protein
MIDMRIAYASLSWYVALFFIQLVSSIVARARGGRLPAFSGATVFLVVFIGFTVIRQFWNSTLSLKVLSALGCAYCISALVYRAARGEFWSAGETNVVAFACLCAAMACIDAPAVALALFVLATIVATIATAMVVRLASGSSTPAR